MVRIATTLFTIVILTAMLAGCARQPKSVMLTAAADAPYVLDRGDKLRITVFGQTNLTGVFAVDAAGMVTLPLIGGVPAAGLTTPELQRSIEAGLRKGYLREPDVTVEIDSYRPFFVLGEVTTSGQYPYLAGMSAEKAIAVAGGFSPRARHDKVTIARRMGNRLVRFDVPVSTPIRPGDVVTVRERWF